MKLGIFLISLAVVLSGCTLQRGPEVLPTTPEPSKILETTTKPVVTETEQPKPIVNSASEVDDTDPKPVEDVEPAEAPQSINLPVLFASQAPFGVWDDLHGEACEEASMIMAVKYFEDKPLSAHIMEQEILDLISWEEENGYKIDATASETVDILKKYFSRSADVVIDVTQERMKAELAKGNLIIIPAAGRELGNPYFQTPGPIYHMLVIRGYDDRTGEFITNDPGTRRGEGYRYKYKTLINAIHDWSHARAEGGMTDAEMAQGRKVIIVVTK